MTIVATAPETLPECQNLQEIDNQTPHVSDFSLPVYHFLDTDNRLMRVVKNVEGFFRKMEEPCPS